MFNKSFNAYLSVCIIVCSIFLFTACTENARTSSNPNKPIIINDKEKIAEYIIVLEKGVLISQAIYILQMYDIQVIKDLNRDRYVIGLKKDPGIKQLETDILDSSIILHIQPNFIYEKQ